ncbi:hypothetical protein DMENIID0001_071950 [Sergentomyia squamirostris]
MQAPLARGASGWVHSPQRDTTWWAKTSRELIQQTPPHVHFSVNHLTDALDDVFFAPWSCAILKILLRGR